MYTANIFTHSLLLSAFSFAFGYASPRDIHGRAIDCADPKVKSLVSTARAVASAEIDPFCSSYLHYSPPVTTTTVITTSTHVSTSTVTKGTTTITVTVPEKGSNSKRDCCKEKRNPVPAPAETLSSDSSGKVLGYAADIVSAACSCLVPKPTKTSTVTKTSTKVTTSVTTTTVKETKTVTVTSKQSTTSKTGPSTTTSKAATSKTTGYSTGKTSTASTSKLATSTTTGTSKTTGSSTGKMSSTTTKSSTKTSSATTATGSSTLTQCGSANPTFKIQLKDPGTRTDMYNNQYLATAPDTYRDVGSGWVMTTTPSLSAAVVVILELSTRRLKTVNEGWYANAEYSLSLTPTYFDPKTFINTVHWQYFDCAIASGILTCSVPDPTFRTVMQTCPEYVEAFYTPVALGDQEYVDGPVCYRKNMVVIPVCTPK